MKACDTIFWIDLNAGLLLQGCVQRGELSSLQLETVVYANMRFNGPLLPDGARALPLQRRSPLSCSSCCCGRVVQTESV